MCSNVFDATDDCFDWAVSGEDGFLVYGLCSDSVFLVRDVECCGGVAFV